MRKLVIIGHKDDCVQLRSGYDFRSTVQRYRIAEVFEDAKVEIPECDESSCRIGGFAELIFDKQQAAKDMHEWLRGS